MDDKVNFPSVQTIEARYPVRTSRSYKLPFGYEWVDDNKKEIKPKYETMKYLDYGMDQLDKGATLREISEWITDKTGEKLSHMGLDKIWKKHRPNSPRREAFLKAERKKKRQRKLSRQEILERNRKRKISSEKRRITFAKRKIEKLADEIGELEKYKSSNILEIDYSVLDLNANPEEAPQEAVFRPNPGPQTEFLVSSEREVLYGGAAGGGKSFALLADPVRYFEIPGFNGILLRRTNDELRELIWKSQELYKKTYGKDITWSERKSSWALPGGGHLWFTYLDRDEDVLRYQGQSFTWIGFDELTQYPTPFPWTYLSTRLRTTEPRLKPHLSMRATTNPGGPGHGWVKKMFIDPAPANTAFPATDMETDEPMVYPEGEPKAGQPLFYRRFIPANLQDNPYLAEDGVYRASLLAQPEQTRRQLLEGDWTVADGAAFQEFRMGIHTCEPFDIPEDWFRFRSCDYGYSERQASAVYWYAVDPTYGILYVYRELYVHRHTGPMLAKRVLELERGERISYGVLDSSVWAQRGNSGPSIAEEMIKAGCRWRPSDRSAGSRVAGKHRLHELLRIDPVNNKPGIIIFDTCRKLIADLPVIPMSKTDDDIDKRFAQDHAYDSLRYGIMSRPKQSAGWDTTWKKSIPSFTPSDPVFGY